MDSEIRVADGTTAIRVREGETHILSDQCRITEFEDTRQISGVGITVEDGGELVIRPGTEIFVEGPRSLIGIRLLGDARIVLAKCDEGPVVTQSPPVYVMVSGGATGIECPKYPDTTGFSIWATLESHGIRVIRTEK